MEFLEHKDKGEAGGKNKIGGSRKARQRARVAAARQEVADAEISTTASTAVAFEPPRPPAPPKQEVYDGGHAENGADEAADARGAQTSWPQELLATLLHESRPRRQPRGLHALGCFFWNNKTALVRCDLNLPLKADGSYRSLDRLRAVIPTIDHLVDAGARVIICAHMGRPEGVWDERLSMKPVAKLMGEIMDKVIATAADMDVARELAKNMEKGDILMLENIRFSRGETENDSTLAGDLAWLADVFVNDAFASAHRCHASTVGVANLMRPCLAGLLMEKEIDYLMNDIDDPARPFAALLGAEAFTIEQAKLVESLLYKADKFVIGGRFAGTFLKAKGLSPAGWCIEEDMIVVAEHLLSTAVSRGVTLTLPAKEGTGFTREILATIGDCETILWNGLLDCAGNPLSAKITEDVARYVARVTGEDDRLSILAGDTLVATVTELGLAEAMSHISTGGAPAIRIVTGDGLPAVDALDAFDEDVGDPSRADPPRADDSSGEDAFMTMAAVRLHAGEGIDDPIGDWFEFE